MVKLLFSTLFLTQSVFASEISILTEKTNPQSQIKPLEYKLPGDHEGGVTVLDESNGAIRIVAVHNPTKHHIEDKILNYRYYVTLGEGGLEKKFDRYSGRRFLNDPSGLYYTAEYWLYYSLSFKILKDEGEIYKIVETDPYGDTINYVDLADIKKYPKYRFLWQNKPTSITEEQARDLFVKFYKLYSYLIPVKAYYNRHGIVTKSDVYTFDMQGKPKYFVTRDLFSNADVNRKFEAKNLIYGKDEKGIKDINYREPEEQSLPKKCRSACSIDPYLFHTINGEFAILMDVNSILVDLLDEEIVGEEKADKFLSLLINSEEFNSSKFLSLANYLASLDAASQDSTKISRKTLSFYRRLIKHCRNNQNSELDKLKVINSLAAQALMKLGDFYMTSDEVSPETRLENATYYYLLSAKLGNLEASQRFDPSVFSLINLNQEENDKIDLENISGTPETVAHLIGVIYKLSKS